MKITFRVNYCGEEVGQRKFFNQREREREKEEREREREREKERERERERKRAREREPVVLVKRYLGIALLQNI